MSEDIEIDLTTGPHHPRDLVADLPGAMDRETEGRVILGLMSLSNAIRDNNFEKGWRAPDSTPRPIGELVALLHSEVTEAFEAYRNNEPELWYEHDIFTNSVARKSGPGDGCADQQSLTDIEGKEVLGKPQGMASELADVIIRVLDWADEHELPIYTAILDKHRYNLTREYRHGMKAV